MLTFITEYKAILKEERTELIEPVMENPYRFIKFSELVVGDQLLLNNMMQTDKCVVDSISSESVFVRWNDNTTDEVSLNEDVIVVTDDKFTTCGFQIRK